MLHTSCRLLEQLLLLMRLHHSNIALHVKVFLAVNDVMSCSLERIIRVRLEDLPVVVAGLRLLTALWHIHRRSASDRTIQIRFRLVHIRSSITSLLECKVSEVCAIFRQVGYLRFAGRIVLLVSDILRSSW